ncbi:hypothetical protein R5R35_011920 [Gryllus longicercus]|uniref:Ribosomal RNA-processing protein 14/surfeit locus protein 6 C-terminal domain-containing protein n=1 Tax=Gryllus longicercus TaxID=2509291 RepID=A0AAN9W3J2_9ORTH|nr:Surfeit locus protein 6 homolog [Gryllus bimaculatus]
MKLQNEKMNKLDKNSIRKNLLQENKYIMNLWQRFPWQNSSDIKEASIDIAIKTQRSAKLLFAPNRAHTLEELQSKLEGIKGKSLQYKSKLKRKRLKNKIEKLKGKDKRKFKKTLTKVDKEPREVKVEMKPTSSKPAKPVFNSEGKMVFSKFDFAESPFIGNETRNKKETKDPHKLLRKIEKQKEKLKLLEEKGEVKKVDEIKEKQAWKTAFQKTAGIKVKDDPQLLQNTIKKKIQQKKKSRKAWKARESQVQKQMEERQQKRQSNIDEHKRKKKSKKTQRLVKKGRLIPGLT